MLVNNAGYSSYGAIEDVPLEEGRRQFDVNLFGMARLIQLVTPAMREQHYGKIVNISSMGGKIWTKSAAGIMPRNRLLRACLTACVWNCGPLALM